MLFHTPPFLVFFAVVYTVYLLLDRRGQNLWLLGASIVFYGSWDYRFLALLLISTVVDYGVGLGISSTPDKRARRGYLTLSLLVNLGILGYFKYYNFFIESADSFLSTIGLSFSPVLISVILPLGISFYTFQTLSYSFDVYYEVTQAEKNFIDYALYVAFFPQLVAGPIVRMNELIGQIKRDRTIQFDDIREGGFLFLQGAFKKIVIADNLARVVDAVYAPAANPSGLMVVVATYAFAFQIYCDFSGYSNMARGVARLMGFELPVNFARPYFAESIPSFWRRWHISLFTWLKDYLFFPVAQFLQRRIPDKPILTTGLALLITFTLCGLWHGAGWQFVFWGAYFGLLLWLSRAIQGSILERGLGHLPRVVKIIGTFHLVCIGWLLFRSSSLGQARKLWTALFDRTYWTVAEGAVSRSTTPWQMLATMYENQWMVEATVAMAGIAATAGALLILEYFQERFGEMVVVHSPNRLVRSAVYVSLFYAIVLFGAQGNVPFIYFQF